MSSERPAGGGFISPFAAFQRNARLLILAVFLDGMAVAFVMLFFNFFILARGYDIGFLGIANSMPAIAVLVLGYPLGHFADRVGYRTSMLLGVTVAYSALGAALFTASPFVLLGAMALQGAGSMLFYLSINPFLMKHSDPAERPLLFSMNIGLQILAGAGGSLLAGRLPGWLQVAWGILPGSAESYRIVLFAGLLCGMLALLPLFLVRHIAPSSDSTEGGEHRREAGWSAGEKRVVLRMCLPNLLIGFGAALLIPYLNIFFRQRFSTPDSALGALFSLSAVFTGLATLLSPGVARRLGSKTRAAAATQSGSLLFLLLLGFIPVFPLAVAAFFLRAGLMNMSLPLYSAFRFSTALYRHRILICGGHRGDLEISLPLGSGWSRRKQRDSSPPGLAAPRFRSVFAPCRRHRRPDGALNIHFFYNLRVDS
jgi:MFS family permease